MPKSRVILEKQFFAALPCFFAWTYFFAQIIGSEASIEQDLSAEILLRILLMS